MGACAWGRGLIGTGTGGGLDLEEEAIGPGVGTGVGSGDRPMKDEVGGAETPGVGSGRRKALTTVGLVGFA